MEQIPPSGTLRMFELAKRLEGEGKRIYHFEVGQPDFPTPQNIVDAGIKALRDGFTKYTSSRGIIPLREAIQSYYGRRGMEIDANKNIIVTPGAKMALFSGFLATLDRGDDVLLLAPAWPTYRVMVRSVGAKPVDVNMGADYSLIEERLKDCVSRSVTAMIINTPNNPTGGVLEKDDMRLIHDLSEDHDFVVFSDEIYESIVYDGFKQTSMLEMDPTLEHTLVINGFSKSYSMTGWRLGYAIGNDETIGNMNRIQQNTTSCAASFVQVAGVEALEGDQSSIESMITEYHRRRDEVTSSFCAIEGVGCVRPRGAFYVFPDFAAFGLSSSTLAELILKKAGVTSTPGSVFGEKYDSHLRFSYATSIEEIREGLAHLADFLSTMY
ncbi:MAG: pyridoxal phosphate-dependent aminotransferase [Candidatus Thorarchaeota archaeon]